MFFSFVCRRVALLPLAISLLWNLGATASQAQTPSSLAVDPQQDAASFRPETLNQSDRPRTTRALIGADDRVPVTTTLYPWSTVGIFYWLDAEGLVFSSCTGTLIGRDLVLTNSHCLYNSLTDEVVSPERYAAGQETLVFIPNMIEGYFAETDVATVLPDFVYGWANGEESVEADWAVVRIDQNLGDTYGYLGWNAVDFDDPEVQAFLHENVNVMGYSGDFPNADQKEKWALEGEAGETAGVHLGCSIEADVDGVLVHTCDTMSGASGSAMIARFPDENYYIIGLHRGSVDLAPELFPATLRETCARFDAEAGDVVEVAACRNLSVAVSQWGAAALTQRQATQP
jgi:protease YdgD